MDDEVVRLRGQAWAVESARLDRAIARAVGVKERLARGAPGESSIDAATLASHIERGLEAIHAPERMSDAPPRMHKLLGAVLLFHSGGVWDEAKQAAWERATGAEEATTRTLCDAIRRYLGDTL